jgi:outer membrane receptor for ferrienterochelin and colicin
MKAQIPFLPFALLIVLAVSASMLYAGTGGKIAGRVSDATTGQPLVAANIVLKGTSMGASADLDGNYAILNIPPGVYTVVVSMIGYRQEQIENVSVTTDLTTTVNATLQESAVEVGPIVITAERPIVTRDMTSSISTTTAEQIQNLPVISVQQVLRLSAGVIEDGGRLSIRGGRTSEVAYWVDGISATDPYNFTMGVTVQPAAVQELQLISGTFNAEYGQAMSGIVNIITKQGSKSYAGEVKVYTGDYVSNGDKFRVYKNLVTKADPITSGTDIVSGDYENPLKEFNPVYDAELSLSGPVPLLGDNLTFFANGRYFYDRGYFYGRNWFTPNGTPGDSSLVALNPLETTSLQGKLNYQLSSALRVSYNIFWNKSDRERNYYRFGGQVDYFQGFDSRIHKYVPYGVPEFHSTGYTHTFMLNHTISPSTFYELRASKYYSESKQYVFDDPTAAVKWLVSVQEDTTKGIVAEVFDPTTPEGIAELNRINTLGGSYDYIADPNGPQGYLDPQSANNQPASYSFLNKGMDVIRATRSSGYWVGKLDLTSQVNKTHQLKLGSEVRLHELKLYSYQVVPKTDASGQQLIPFQPAIPDVNSIYEADYDRKPREISAYVQDKVEFNDIILNLGLRYDYFDPNASIFTDPTDPNIYAPFKPEHIYKNYAPGVPEEDLVQYTPEERRAFMQRKVDAKMALSPRLGIAFPITDRGVIHFSYGHFFQVPEFQYLYTSPDFKITSGSGNGLFGNPDLKPQKTVMYELGLQQQLFTDIGVDVTLFYRDIRDWVGTSRLLDTYKTGVKYSIFENKDYENVRGITLKLDKRMSNNFSFRVDYTLQIAEGTYSSPTDEYNASINNQAPQLMLIPMSWDQRHTVNVQLMYDLSGWTVSLIGRYWSGRPYTPSFPASESVGQSAVFGLPPNSSRNPAQRGLDMTINKAFPLASRVNLNLFVNVYNVLDLRDAVAVYTDTGSPDYTTAINPSQIPYSASRVGTVQDFVNNSNFYTAPRQVQVGLALDF